MSLTERFARAYNTGDLDVWADVFEENATAQVLNAPMPIEVGRAKIKETSCAHMLNTPEQPLVARAVGDADVETVVFLVAADETQLDCAVLINGNELVDSAKYHVWWHSEDWLQGFANQHGFRRAD